MGVASGSVTLTRKSAVGRAAGGAAGRRAVGSASLPDPVVTCCGTLGQFRLHRFRELDRQRPGGSDPACSARIATFPCILTIADLRDEELGEVGFDGKAGSERVGGGVCLDFRGVNVEFLAPDQAGLEALLHDALKERPEDLKPVALPNACQARVVR
jgi:hypothetical protein